MQAPALVITAEVVRAHQHAVWRWLRVLGRRPPEADDLAQETFLVLVWLHGLQQLRSLRIASDAVTAEGRAALRAALPRCTISDEIW